MPTLQAESLTPDGEAKAYHDPVRELRLELGSYLRQVLGRRGMTASRLAALTGMTQNRLSLIRTGGCVITEGELLRICAAIPDLTEEEQMNLQDLGARAARSKWSVAAVNLKNGETRVLPPTGPPRKALIEEVAEIKQMLYDLKGAMEQLIEKIG